MVRNSIDNPSVARQPNCVCGFDDAVNENDRMTSRCNATKKLEARVIFSPNFINDRNKANNKVPFATPHFVTSFTGEETREKLVYGTKTSFLDLKQSGFYRIEIKACQKPLPCDDFSFIPCSSLKDNLRQSGNESPPIIPLYKLCSLHIAVGGVTVVKRNESRGFYLEVRNNSRENDSGVELTWSKNREFPPTDVFVYFVEIRNDTTQKILRRSYLGPSNVLTHQSATIKDLASGNYFARVSAVNTDGTFTVTGWVPFYYLDKKSERKRAMIRVMKVVIAIEILIIALAYFLWRRIRSNQFFSSNDTISKTEGITGRPSLSSLFKEEMKLSRDQLEIHTERKLGSGHFSNVYEATLRTEMGEFVKAAVKIPHPNFMPCELNKFMKEPTILQNLSSNHVVKLLGVVLDDYPCLFVLEFLANKDLKTLLTEMKKRVNSLLPTHTLIRMACEAADGMAYLSSQNLVHKDLAARNCLVGGANQNLKISDLGLAGPPEESNTNDEEAAGYLPVRWMAPESLKNKRFTTESDVWSYGVLLWEMSTGGKTPYEELGHEEVAKNVVSEGCSLPKPVLSIPPFESVMMKCWHSFPAHRPSFSSIFEYLIGFLEQGRERESLEAISYCFNQQKLGDESAFSLNGRDESFLSWEERESRSFMSQCPLVRAPSQSDINTFSPSQSSGINLVKSKEITKRMYQNSNVTLFSSVRDPEPCHSKKLTSFHEEPTLSGTTKCLQNPKGVRRLQQEVESVCFKYNSIPSKEENLLNNDLVSRNFSLELNIGNSQEALEMTKHSMMDRITERFLSFSSNSSLHEFSPFKRLADTYNLNSCKERKFFNSDDPESSSHLISPSEFSEPSTVTTTIPVAPIIRSSVPFVGSSVPVFYCQCPTEAEPTFEHHDSSSRFSYNDDTRNLINDYPLLHNSNNLISLHQKHFCRKTGKETTGTPRLSTSQSKYIQ